MAEKMWYTKNGVRHDPLIVVPINGEYLLGVYQGNLSQHDILLRYKQKDASGKWSRLRTPKHIHWTVDVLIKLNEDESETKRFLDFLIRHWQHTQPIMTASERDDLLNVTTLLAEVQGEAEHYKSLSAIGEYSVKFLFLVAKLLMVQEKTNRADAYMFGKVLDKLKDDDDIFSVIHAATFRGR
ncbi:MAG: hypothetical protein FWC99_03475 [Coriobacteriia bacterium]|nr:hypothetical protein [Coriobacteriia bacterium]